MTPTFPRFEVSGHAGAVHRRRPSPRQRAIAKAKSHGPITEIEPTKRRRDGSPIAQPGEVYIFGTSTVYHPHWCRTVGENWDQHPNRLKLTRITDTGTRKPCATCATSGPITD